MFTRVPLFRSTAGLNTVSDPAELKHDPQTGDIDLSLALNVQIELSGKRYSRRKGTILACAGVFHDGFCGGNTVLCVQEFPPWAALMRVDTGNPPTLTGVRDSLTNNRRMAYCHVNEKIYYSNTLQTGIYDCVAGTSGPWVRGEYVGHATDKELYDPPAGHIIEVLGGFMLIADGSVIWVSEEWDYNAYNLANRYFDIVEPLTMLKVVGDGVWVGTHKETIFLAGVDPDQWQVGRRIPYGVKEHSVIQQRVTPAEIGAEQGGGEGFLWMSHRGVCWGGPQGSFENLTEKLIHWQDLAGRTGAGEIIGGRVVFTIDP